MASAMILKAIDFAAKKHRDQRRKDPQQTPYINHPAGVAFSLVNEGQLKPDTSGDDLVAIVAAILHDTVEDTDATIEEIHTVFGAEIAKVVGEVTDDTSLPRAVRKQKQVDSAAKKSRAAKCVKLADKLYNLRDLARAVPTGWTAERVQEYFAWSQKVVHECRGANAPLEAILAELFATGTFSFEGRTLPCLPTASHAKMVDLPLRQRYEAAGQGQVFALWDDLSDAQRESLLQQLQQIDPVRINRIYKQATAPKSADVAAMKMEPLPAESYDNVEIVSAEQAAKWNQVGLDAIKAKQLAIVLLAGGQGTRLGSAQPKGCYDIGLPSHKSLFQLQAERIQRLNVMSKTQIQWYVMTSGPTRRDTEKYFVDNKYFGLDAANVTFFEQGVLPALTNEGKIIMEAADKVSVAPDGNGGVYASLRNSGILADMKRRGVRYVHAYCVDNCLVRVADPQFVGYCIAKQAQCGVKVVRKLFAQEPVGIICRLNGHFGAVEYSEISQADSESMTASGKLTYDAANIANHFYTTEALEEFCSDQFEQSLEFHIAKKKIKYVDVVTKQQVAPSKPNGIKLELFIFDILAHLPIKSSQLKNALAVFSVPRWQDFSPLKNASGAGADCPETSRKDMFIQSVKFLEQAGVTVTGTDAAYETFNLKQMVPDAAGAMKEQDVQVKQLQLELSPAVSYAGEGLREVVAGKTVHLTHATYVATLDDLVKMCK